jgi:hypothetical protein
MTATAAQASTTEPATTSPSEAFSRVVGAAIELCVVKVSTKLDDWTDKHSHLATEGVEQVSSELGHVVDAGADQLGTKQRVGVKTAVAALLGRNPVWAALKATWVGASTPVKAAVVTAVVAVVLLLVLSPVLLLVFLVAALVIAAVTKARSAKR